jgi:hypothetical protein
VIVPEGIEGKEWLSSFVTDGSQTESEGFARICKVAVDNRVVSAPADPSPDARLSPVSEAPVTCLPTAPINDWSM